MPNSVVLVRAAAALVGLLVLLAKESAEVRRLQGEWEDAVADNEAVWEEGFHKGREYQREADRRG